MSKKILPLISCSPGPTNKIKNKPTIETVLDRHTDCLMRLPGVEGVGIQEDKKGNFIMIYTNVPLKNLKIILPKKLEGYRVKAEYQGTVNKEVIPPGK